jgi:hypothetical protein
MGYNRAMPVLQLPFRMGRHIKVSVLNNRFSVLAIDIYRSLENTPFVSLYASKNWAEDFAEAFSWTYLKQKFDIDYTVEVLQNEIVVFTFSPLQNERFLRRMEYFETIFVE